MTALCLAVPSLHLLPLLFSPLSLPAIPDLLVELFAVLSHLALSLPMDYTVRVESSISLLVTLTMKPYMFADSVKIIIHRYLRLSVSQVAIPEIEKHPVDVCGRHYYGVWIKQGGVLVGTRSLILKNPSKGKIMRGNVPAGSILDVVHDRVREPVLAGIMTCLVNCSFKYKRYRPSGLFSFPPCRPLSGFLISKASPRSFHFI